MLWGNLNKNPRFKSFEFEEEKFQFELPKSLAVADISGKHFSNTNCLSAPGTGVARNLIGGKEPKMKKICDVIFVTFFVDVIMMMSLI